MRISSFQWDNLGNTTHCQLTDKTVVRKSWHSLSLSFTYTHHIHTERCNAYYLLKCTAKTMLHASTGPQARDSRENIVSPVSSIHKHKFSTLMERICYLIYLYFIIERVTERHVLSHIYIYG